MIVFAQSNPEVRTRDVAIREQEACERDLLLAHP
jgi:hypothetical protein